MSAHDLTLTGDYTDHPAALVLLDAATADERPTPFALNTALRNAGGNAFRVREMLDGKLHVCIDSGSRRQWQPLDSLAASILDA
jgi:hypothetical protein